MLKEAGTYTIERLSGLEILDSRGRPTVRATCCLAGGASASASVPSGASTGAAEARELRDGDPRRYAGLGCRRAAAHIGAELNAALAGRAFGNQEELDQAMIALDGTADKSRLGANTLLAVSIAFARACAVDKGVPFYRYLGDLVDVTPQTLPRLSINLFSGGKHAGAQVPIQDVLLVPAAAGSIDEALATASAVYARAADLVHEKYGMRRLTADEGGLAPPFPNAEAMLHDAIESVCGAGFAAGGEVALGVDVAASHFYCEGRYLLGGDALDSDSLIGRLTEWVDRYPIVSIEDGLAEEDWDHWPTLRTALDTRARVVGDDLLCTQTVRIRRAIATRAADTLLLKVNQVGTLSEAAAARAAARTAGWQIIASARSGETEDDWLADLAVGWGVDQIKVGSITQSERLAKYNRLLAIEAETHWPPANVLPHRHGGGR